MLLLAKGTQFEAVSKDIELYKHERQIIDRRISDAVTEITLKANKADVSEMRLYFDSQLTTEQTNTSQRFATLTEDLQRQQLLREKNERKTAEETAKQLGLQQQINQELRQSLRQTRNWAEKEQDKLQQRIDSLQKNLRDQLSRLWAKEEKDTTDLKNSINGLEDGSRKTRIDISDIQRFQQARFEQITEITSMFNALNDTVNQIIDENAKRQRQLQQQQLQRLSEAQTQNHIGDEVSSVNSAVEQLRTELMEHRRELRTIKQSVDDVSRKHDKTAIDLVDKHKQWQQTAAQNHQETQQKFTETHRRVNEVSIEIMRSLHKSEQEAKDYTDALRMDLQERLELMETLKNDMEILKKSFRQQIEETERLNRALSDKMQKINTMLTKFKSDLTLRIQNTSNEMQRRALQIKDNARILDQVRRHLSFLNECLSIVLAAAVAREFLEEGSNDQIKIASLLEGWVLEVEEKVARYRSDPLHRRKLLQLCLSSLSAAGDKLKGGILENGKQVYNRMMDEQQIFTARKRGLSKKGGSELPKLYY